MATTDNPDKVGEKILSLPSDWWQKFSTQSALISHFKRHILPLLIAISDDGRVEYNIYSGIPLLYDETYIWLTAGHVIDELIQIKSQHQIKILSIAWLDGYEDSQAGLIPLHRIDIPMKSWKGTGFDVGVALPSILDVKNLQANEKIITLGKEIWVNLPQANPEGFLAFGCPRTYCNQSQSLTPDNKTLYKVNGNIICLPIERIPPPKEFTEDEVWSNPEAFYGKVIPYPDIPQYDFDDAKGMSGGPIFSIERDPNGRIRYRLVGIIQSFARGQSIFRAEPIKKVGEVIDAWLEEEKSTN